VPCVATDPGSVLLPGVIDLHVHAPQWPQLGTGLDLPLEEWLFAHTFPLEARYSDPAFAAAVWPDLVGTLLRHGTTTAVYFATNDRAATTALAHEAVRQGQRAYVGRVAMDHPEGTPEWYRDASPAAGVAESALSIEEIRAADAAAVSCSRSSRPASPPPAPTRCWRVWANWPPPPVHWCRPTAARATGRTATRSIASAPPTPRRSNDSVCCATARCWRTPTTSPTTTPR
jgi:hypothetical protein